MIKPIKFWHLFAMLCLVVIAHRVFGNTGLILSTGVCAILTSFLQGSREETKASTDCFFALLKNDHDKVVETVMPGLEKKWKYLRFFTAGAASAIFINDIDKAEALATRAKEMDPKHTDTILAMFLVKARRLKCDEAEILGQRLLEKDPKLKQIVLFERTKMYADTFDFGKAFEALSQLETKTSAGIPLWTLQTLRVEILLKAGKCKQALDLARKTHEEWHGKLPLENKAALDGSLADALMANSYWTGAIEAFTATYQNNRKFYKALLFRAGCQIELQEFDKARADLDEFDKLNKSNDNIHMAKCFRALISDNLEDAQRLAKEAVLVDPLRPFTHYVLARILLGKEDSQKAIESLNRAIEINPNYIDAYKLRAFAWKALGDWNKSEADENHIKVITRDRKGEVGDI